MIAEVRRNPSISRTATKLATLLFANVQDGFVDGVAQFAAGQGGEGFSRLADGLIEDAPLVGQIFAKLDVSQFFEQIKNSAFNSLPFGDSTLW